MVWYCHQFMYMGETKITSPWISCYTCLPPGSLHALEANQLASKLIQNDMHGRFIMHIDSVPNYGFAFIFKTVPMQCPYSTIVVSIQQHLFPVILAWKLPYHVPKTSFCLADICPECRLNDFKNIHTAIVPLFCCSWYRSYPAKRALPAMLTHGRYDPFGRIPSIYTLMVLHKWQEITTSCVPLEIYDSGHWDKGPRICFQ